MKSWATGKQELLQELETVYESIGRNLLAELSEQSTARVDTAQQRLLQDQSSKYKDLIEKHPNVEDDLLDYKRVCSRLNELLDGNKRLTAELEQARRKQTPISSAPARPAHIVSDPRIPLATTSTGSKFLHLLDPIHFKTGTEQDCEALIDKYTIVFKEWETEKGKRKSYEAKWKRERDKVKDWVKYSERQDKTIASKRDIIKHLKDELRLLRSHPDGFRFDSEIRLSDGLSRSPAEIPDSMFPGISPASSPLAKVDAQSLSAPAASRALDEDKPDIVSVPKAEIQECMVTRATLPGQLSHEETQDLQLTSLSHTAKTIILDSQAESDNESPIYHELITMGETLASKEDGAYPCETDAIKQEADDHESPVVVSARTIKKRKRGSENELPKPIINVKQENISSSPIGLNVFENLGSNDSVDLDEIGQKVDTPRKHRRRLFELSQEQGTTSRRATVGMQSLVQCQTPEQAKASPKQAFQTTPARKPVERWTGSALQPRSANEQIVSRLQNQASKKRRLISDNEVESLAEDGSRPIPLSSRKNRAATDILAGLLGKPPSPTRAAINPRPSNRRLDVTATTTPQHTRKAHEARVNKRGLNNSSLYSRPFNTNASDSSGSSASKGEIRRQFLASETPRHSGELTASGAQTRRTSIRITPSLAELETDQVCEPIRSRPVASFRLEDFKVNPAYNQGYSYAYTEVVRNKDDRRCLQGCTKPGCCGERFRALALATRPVGELTLSQEEADNELLQEFLGDNAYKLRNLNKQDRDDLLLQAKTRELANKHGRHRHTYEKPSSPPGFWRADFPSTQEDLLDREKAKQAQRDQIMQRYEEAMRPGGAFLFRDE